MSRMPGWYQTSKTLQCSQNLVIRHAQDVILSCPGGTPRGTSTVGAMACRWPRTVQPHQLGRISVFRYCLSKTPTSSTVSCPRASMPVVVVVIVFPSLDTTDVRVIMTFPSFFWIVVVVFA